MNLDITIPAGSTGIIYLPTLGTAQTNLTVQESGVTIWQNGAATGSDQWVAYDHFQGTNDQTYSVWDVSSGSYQFSWTVFPVPNGLTAQAGNGWVNLKWTPTPGATSYEAKRSTVSGGPYSVLASSVATPYFTDAAVTNGQTYYYVVSANSSNGQSANSTQACATTPSGISNYSFETPNVSGGYEYNPSYAGWTFSGASPNGSGILGNGSAFGNPNAPDGVQAAFVEEYGTISQTLYGFVPGTVYTITYYGAQRSGANQNGGESWDIMIDNTVIATNRPGLASYTIYTATFTATATTHTLSFVGTDLATGDNTVFIDDVQISPALFGLPPPKVTLFSPANNSTFLSSGTINLVATVVTNGDEINGVEFVANATNLLGGSEDGPYAFSWTNVPAGAYILTAGVIFNGGGVVDSSTAANIVVTNLPPVIGAITLGVRGKQIDISGAGQAGHAYILDAATNLLPPIIWCPLLTNPADTSGNIFFTNLSTINAQQFFRIAAP